LKTFVFERIGVSRKNDTAQIRRTLAKPIEELVQFGFLLPNRQRFRKIPGQRCEWEVIFSLAGHVPPVVKRSASMPKVAQAESPRQPVKADKWDRYLANMPVQQQREIESQAMQGASGFLLETLEGQQDGPLADECRKQIVKAFLKNGVKQ
jgi:hypothetical protein